MAYRLQLLDGNEYVLPPEHQPVDCFCCGYCCVGYNPMVEDWEIRRMADSLGLSPNDFRREYIEETLIGSLLKQTDRGCAFLRLEDSSGKGYCSIHSARPEACRDWVASLERRECLAGLALLRGEKGAVLEAGAVFEDKTGLDNFMRTLKRT